MNEELTNLLEGIETANNIKKYDEVLGDLVHKAGNAIKNVFSTKAGAAQRAQADAQQNLQNAQAIQQANLMNAQANAISGAEAAQNIINILQKSFKKAQVTQQKATNAANKEAKKQNNENEKQQNSNGTQQVEGNNG